MFFIESRAGVLLLAGLGFFTLAFLSNGLVPAFMYDYEEQTVEQKIDEQLRDPKRSWTVVSQFQDLHQRYPEQFEKYFGKPPEEDLADPNRNRPWWTEKTAEALRLGHRVYVGEACWHCHSQFVRPEPTVTDPRTGQERPSEEIRWGPVAQSKEYDYELQRPVLFGTRRVGPDLSREGGRRGNDWHAAHFFNPRDVVGNSVMPQYPWFYDADPVSGERSPGLPNQRGLAVITYMQFLSSWLEDYPYADNRDAQSFRTEGR